MCFCCWESNGSTHYDKEGRGLINGFAAVWGEDMCGACARGVLLGF